MIVYYYVIFILRNFVICFVCFLFFICINIVPLRIIFFITFTKYIKAYKSFSYEHKRTIKKRCSIVIIEYLF